MKTLVYAGSFDPITLGHLNIIERASHLCDELVVLLSSSKNKNYQFTIEQRQNFLKESTESIKNVRVDSFGGLLADYMQKNSYTCLLRGLRGPKDWYLEETMFITNKALSGNLETLCLLASPKYRHISSSLVKELTPHLVDWKKFVPPCVEKCLK
ncbi:MAG: pantetheine-phosphate adenylyltransferase [Bdellovibrionaceae bacterium]|nr:pantetheine-phosphate adenylyltransferase [Pseudobdellovibrionaceae bacterium]